MNRFFAFGRTLFAAVVVACCFAGAASAADTTPPTGMFDYPQATVAANDLVLYPSASDSESGLASAVCWFDNSSHLPCPPDTIQFWPWSTPSAGVHTLYMLLCDNAGNCATISKSITVLSYGPVFEVAEPTGVLRTHTPHFEITDRVANPYPGSYYCDLFLIGVPTYIPCDTGDPAEWLPDGTYHLNASQMDSSYDLYSDSFTFSIDTTGPAVSVSAPSGTVTTSATPQIVFSASDANGTSGASCSLDGGVQFACASGQNLPPMKNGAHTVTVSVTDSLQNPSTFSKAFTINFADSTSPSAPTSVTANAISKTSATIRWTASTDNVKLSSYNVYKNGAYLDWVPGTLTSYAMTGLTCGTSYTTSITALDQADNWAYSPTVSFTTAPCAAPAVTIVSPANGSSFPSGALSVSFNATNSPTSYSCKLDSAAPYACGSPVTLASLAVGNHSLVVSATNASGTGSAVVNFSIDSTPPDTVITGKPANQTQGTSASFAFNSNEAGVTYQCSRDFVAFSACASAKAYTGLSLGDHYFQVRAVDAAGNVDPTPASALWNVVTIPSIVLTEPATQPSFTSSGIYVKFIVIGGAAPYASTCSLDGGAPETCYGSRYYSQPSEGSHSVLISTTDTLNNTSSTTVSFTVDRTAPETTITSQPSNPTSNTSASFSFASNEPGSTFVCWIDQPLNWEMCSGSKLYSGLGTGSHTFGVRATDRAGNFDYSEATYTWVVNAAAPSVTINSPAAGLLTNSTTVGVGFAVSGGTAPYTTTCAIDGGSASSCTSTKTYAGLSSATHTVTVSATDAANNSSSASVSFTVDTVPPETTIISGPTAGSTITTSSATLGFSSPDPTATFQCKVDTGNYSSCNSPASFTGLSNASHAIYVQAKDPAGNADPTPASRTFIVSAVDTTPPTAPSNLAASSITKTAATITWAASTDAVGVVEYDIFRNGSYLDFLWNNGNPPATSYSMTGLACNTTYSTYVAALDAAGNNNWSSTLSFTTSAC